MKRGWSVSLVGLLLRETGWKQNSVSSDALELQIKRKRKKVRDSKGGSDEGRDNESKRVKTEDE